MKHTNLGSISAGTMRPEDLIPCFLSELRSQKPLRRAHAKLAKGIEWRAYEWSQSIEGMEYFNSDDAHEDLNVLADALSEYAPTYFYFGAHPGDGADYGYWLSEGFQDDFDGLTVSDLSEVPKGHSGEVLHVNDHGNMTLYACSRGRLREVWGLV